MRDPFGEDQLADNPTTTTTKASAVLNAFGPGEEAEFKEKV